MSLIVMASIHGTSSNIIDKANDAANAISANIKIESIHSSIIRVGSTNIVEKAALRGECKIAKSRSPS